MDFKAVGVFYKSACDAAGVLLQLMEVRESCVGGNANGLPSMCKAHVKVCLVYFKLEYV
jgi:hypothetical protein